MFSCSACCACVVVCEFKCGGTRFAANVASDGWASDGFILRCCGIKPVSPRPLGGEVELGEDDFSRLPGFDQGIVGIGGRAIAIAAVVDPDGLLGDTVAVVLVEPSCGKE